MGYRNEDGELSREQRVERLEDAVARVSVRKIVGTLKWGIIILLGGVGIGVAMYGISFALTARLEGDALIAQQDTVPRAAARQECVEACGNAEMSIERARIVPDSDEEGFHAATCSCISADGDRRALWHDLRDQCSRACDAAGMGVQRPVFRGDRIVACGCVDENTHRTLWDDRNAPRCESVATDDHNGTMRCRLVEGTWNP